MRMSPGQWRWFQEFVRRREARRDPEARQYPHSPLMERRRPTGNRITVSLSEKRVSVARPDGTVVREFPAYVGSAAKPTPQGVFRITENRHPFLRDRVYAGHWLGFAYDYDKAMPPDEAAYAGFHGWRTSAADLEEEKENPGWLTSTEGCVQLNNNDAHELSKIVGPGDRVTVTDKPLGTRRFYTHDQYRRYRQSRGLLGRLRGGA